MSLCHCLQFLDQAEAVADILVQLCTPNSAAATGHANAANASTHAHVSKDVFNVTLAYQIAFDLVESENQVSLLRLYRSIRSSAYFFNQRVPFKAGTRCLSEGWASIPVGGRNSLSHCCSISYANQLAMCVCGT